MVSGLAGLRPSAALASSGGDPAAPKARALAAKYLAARSGDYVVGETIAVDGGVVYGSAAETISP